MTGATSSRGGVELGFKRLRVVLSRVSSLERFGSMTWGFRTGFARVVETGPEPDWRSTRGCAEVMGSAGLAGETFGTNGTEETFGMREGGSAWRGS